MHNFRDFADMVFEKPEGGVRNHEGGRILVHLFFNRLRG
jgi:hypothetical protein